MKITISSLIGCHVQPLRRNGNTTRCIDNAIQIIFRGNICRCEDPWMCGEHRMANENLFGRILIRLWSEHHLSPKEGLMVDSSKLTIELL